LFKPNVINKKVHSATCSCFGELYKQWYTLADFLPNRDFCGVLRITNLAVRISAAVMAGDIILFSIYYSPEGRAQLRLVGRVGGGGEGGSFLFFRVPNSLEECDGWGEGGEYYISKTRWYGGKIYAPGSRIAHLG
jgi:hypothetical protein